MVEARLGGEHLFVELAAERGHAGLDAQDLERVGVSRHEAERAAGVRQRGVQRFGGSRGREQLAGGQPAEAEAPDHDRHVRDHRIERTVLGRERADPGRRQHRRGRGALEAEPGMGIAHVGERHVVGDDVAVEPFEQGLPHGRAGLEPERCVARQHVQVGDDAALHGEDRRVAARARRERRHVVADLALEPALAVAAGHLHQQPAGVREEPCTGAHGRGDLRRRGGAHDPDPPARGGSAP